MANTGFDPDAYLKKKASEPVGFDPDAYLSKKAVEPADVGPSMGDTAVAALEGAGDALTLGYAPQIKAGVAKGVSAISPFSEQQVLATLDKPIGDVFSGKAYENLPEDDSYVALRDQAIKTAEANKAKDPIGAGLGMGAGILATGGLGANAGLLKSAALGAGTAAAYNPGDTEGVVDPLQADQRAKAAALGGAFGLGGAALSKGAQALAPKLAEASKGLAARAIGRGSKAINKDIGKKGLQEIGDLALENNIVGVIPKTVGQMEEAVNKLRNEVGERIGKVIETTKEAEQKLRAQGQRVGVDKKMLVDKIRTELVDPDTAMFFPDVAEKVEKRLADLVKKGGDDEFLETHGAYLLKQKLGKQMEKNKAWTRLRAGNATDDDVINAVFYDTLGDAVVDSANVLAPALPSQKGIIELNKDYKLLKNMQKISGDEVARSSTNNLFDLTSNIVGTGAGVASSNPLVGLATAAGLNQVRKMGPQVASKVVQGAGNLASKVPQLGPVASGIAAGDLVKKAAENKFPPQPTNGAKVLDVFNYNNSADMVDVPAMDQEMVQAQIMDSDLTNTEKAKIVQQLQKGKVSRKVLDYLSGPKDLGNQDAQSVLGQ